MFDYDDYDFKPNEKGNGLAVVCQWNEREFGRSSDSSPNIDNHWLVMELISNTEEMSERYDFYKNHCGGHVSLEIVDWECLPGLELVGYWKTFWLKLVQRKWKKIFAERRRIESERSKANAIIYREKHGKWQDNINYMPSLKGMMT